jgi:hypothetical protein
MEFETKDYIFKDKDGNEYFSTPLLDEKYYLVLLTSLFAFLIVSFYFTLPI